jgi:hypothetical protein
MGQSTFQAWWLLPQVNRKSTGVDEPCEKSGALSTGADLATAGVPID